MHVLEGLWDAALAVVVAAAARRFIPGRNAWLVAPLLAVTYAQILRSVGGATQLEELVGLPLALALWSTCEACTARDRRTTWLVVAGVASACVLLFKTIYLLTIVGALGLAAAAYLRASGVPPLRTVGRGGAAFAVGLVLPIVSTLAYDAANGTLAAALVTWFVIPPQIVAELPRQDVRVLQIGVVEYVKDALPLLALAGIGTVVAVRERRPLLLGALGWIVAGVIAILIQVTSWWAYQWQLLDVPIALLATAGFGALVTRFALRRGVAIALAVAIAIVPLARARGKLGTMARRGVGATAMQRRAIGDALDPAQARIRQSAATLAKTTAGELYVFGNPLFYADLRARQPIALNGWSPELLVAKQRDELVREIRAARLRYVFVDGTMRVDFERMRARSPAVRRLLEGEYVPRQVAGGTLFTRR
ncbi:MAG: hypothetical protein NVS3B17_19730 [Vulcanimicrobiaceae bacterium]